MHMSEGLKHMTKTSDAIEINSSAEEVFKHLTEPESVHKWVDGLVEIVPLSDETNVVGAKSRQVFHENGRTIEVVEELLVFEPNKRVKIKGDTSGFTYTADYVLHPTANGVRLAYESETIMKNPIMKLMGFMIARITRNKTNADLQRLKKLVEEGANDRSA